MAKVGFILSGCGVDDGSEIHEVVMSLYHLTRLGVEVCAYAPDIEQADVINHATGQLDADATRRNVLAESARLMRGKIKPISDAFAADLDALLVPGGFGAAMNISDFGIRNNVDDMAVELHLDGLIKDMHAAGKPMGFLCIAPASVAAVALRGKGVELTIGADEKIAKRISLLGNTHVEAACDDVVIDEKNNVLSTPAYMLAKDIVEAEKGIAKLVTELVKRAS